MDGNTQLCQFDVDKNSKVYLSDGNRQFSNLFGAGIGYPQRRPDGILLPQKEVRHDVTYYKHPKVDGFDLYRTYVGNTLCK